MIFLSIFTSFNIFFTTFPVSGNFVSFPSKPSGFEIPVRIGLKGERKYPGGEVGVGEGARMLHCHKHVGCG